MKDNRKVSKLKKLRKLFLTLLSIPSMYTLLDPFHKLMSLGLVIVQIAKFPVKPRILDVWQEISGYTN
jgi:hypothetical protein